MHDIPHDSDNCAIARSIIAIAHHLRLNVTAEGVETEEQLEFLREAQCDSVQGCLIARPLNPQDVTALIQSPLYA